MEDRMLIPVMVKGNPCESSGFNPLTSLNNPGFDIGDISYSGFEGCSYFFSIKIDAKQTIYSLIKNGVRSYGASRGGSLTIAFSIPNGFKLDAEKTPYNVLCRFKDVFLENGMTSQTGDVYQFKFNSFNDYFNILGNAVKEFSLVRDTAVRHFPMTGLKTGLIICPEEEIKKFFEDITYPEFAGYSEILVATQCSSQHLYEVLHVEIPRPKIYEVYVDGRFLRKVADFSEAISVSSNQDLRYYENKPTTFTIAWLLEGTQIKGVSINKTLERVDVNTKELDFSPKKKDVYVDIRPSEMKGRINMNNFVLMDGSNQLKLEGGKIVLCGERIALIGGSRITARIIGDDRREIEAVRWMGEDRLVVEVAEKPKPQPIYPPQYVNNGGLNGVPSHNASEPCVEIAISLDKDFFEREARDSKLLVILRDGRGKDNISFQRRVHFDETKDGCKGQFSVVRSQCDGVELVIEGKKKRLLYKISLGNKQKLELSQGNFDARKKPTNSKVCFCLIIALVIFVLGCAVGYCLLANNNGITFNNKKRAFLDDAKLKLESVDLTIARIDSIYDIYSSNKEKYQGFDADICNKINYYHELSEGIKGRSIQKINTCITGNYISEVHTGFINRIVRDEQSEKWFEGKQYQEILNLKDIEKIYEHYCDDCKTYFKDEGTKNNHKNIRCTWTGKNGMCQEKFCTDAGLQKHQEEAKHKSQEGKTNSGGNTYTCTKCNPHKTFKNKNEYNKHMENHVGR